MPHTALSQSQQSCFEVARQAASTLVCLTCCLLLQDPNVADISAIRSYAAVQKNKGPDWLAPHGFANRICSVVLTLNATISSGAFCESVSLCHVKVLPNGLCVLICLIRRGSVSNRRC